jgi:tetratricopeptide (TPR) repeat protein
MNPRLVIRLCLIGLALLLAIWGWEKVKDDPGMMFVYFVAMGSIGGFLAVKFLVPWIGDVIGTLVFSSGEQITVDKSSRAAVKLAQGDYEGAIHEHEKALHENPAQTFPIAEIAKIWTDKLHDPKRGLAVLQEHLSARDWPEDDAAYLMFRALDIKMDVLKDYEGARQLLQEVIGKFPNTRHSANAHHKLNEIDQAEFKQLAEQRLKQASPAQ